MKNLFASTGLCIASLVGLGLMVQWTAEAKDDKPKMSNVQGLVQRMDKPNMTLTVTSRNITKDVVYTSATKFAYGHSKKNKPGSVDAIKDGYFLSCMGTFDAGQVKLQAKECVYRETR